MNKDRMLLQITDILHSSADRISKAWHIAEAIRIAGNYRWVGIYDVDEQEVAVIAWSGMGAPAHPRFPVTQGLSSHAITTRDTVISNDVTNDPRYLTAFGSTQSEIIVPIIESDSRKVIGTLDVESERKGAFADADREQLEKYARMSMGLWQ